MLFYGILLMADSVGSVGRFLAGGKEFLAAAGVETPGTDAEWLMAAVLRRRRGELALHLDDPLSGEQRRRWHGLLEKRAERIPLQHVLGTAPFGDLTLAVDDSVLIPRPETEELIYLLATSPAPRPPRTILDLGTGSGACILALGKAFPEAILAACDCDGAALAVARKNAGACGLGSRVNFVLSDWFDSLAGRWDLIVSNPPYLTEEEWAAAEPEVRRHEPRLALVGGGRDGTACLEKIIGAAEKFLQPSGTLALEMGVEQGEKLKKFAESRGLTRVKILRDLAGRERFLFARRDGD